ncbi:MAG TPA: hypothetical protein VEN81_05340 [Planctomycetota bacterium]|nr:hypothetical protein [Planctomycetota bacterium]
MKTPLRRLGALVLVTLSAGAGCTLGGPPTLEPRETYPHGKEIRRKSLTLTGLVILTERFLDLNLGDPDEGSLLRPTAYTVYNAKGERLLYVRNYIGLRDTEPVPIALDPGQYLILLDKPGDRSPVFWVTVEAERLTEVDVRSLPQEPRRP